MVKDGQDSIDISIVIPVFNEERRIRETLDALLFFFHSRRYRFEIILINDGSKDKTLEIIQKYKDTHNNIIVLKNEKNFGKGYAVRRGMLHAKGGCIFFLDADLSTPIEEVDKLLIFLKQGYEVVIGSRVLPGSKILTPQPIYRKLGRSVFHFFTHLVFPMKISDTQCGFKGFSKKVAKEIFSKQRLNGFCFDVEILYIAKKFGYSIKEIPIVWVNTKKYGKAAFFKNGLLMLKDLIAIRIWNKPGCYDNH